MAHGLNYVWNRRRSAAITAGVAAAALLLAACGTDDESGGDEGELAGATLTVGSKEYTEQVILGYITAGVLEDAGASIVDETGLTGSATVRAALERGEIDIYWDYTGTGWINYLGHTTDDLPDDFFEATRDEDLEQNDIVWLGEASFENTYRVAAKNDFAEANGLETSSDAAAFVNDNPDEARICANSESIARDDGLPAFQETYDIEFPEIVELDLSLVYGQIGSACEFGMVYSTDGRINVNDLRLLDDDEDAFIPYEAAATLRAETLEEYPVIEELMAPVSQALTEEVLIDLNGRVDTDGEQAQDVAQDWLEQEGII